MNGALNRKFVDDRGYEYKIKKDVMEKLNINYEEGGKVKGCIVMMVVRRKPELSKTTIKRAITTHESKILTKRMEVDVQDKGRRNPKQKESCMIHSNDKLQWYDIDGTPYTGKKKEDAIKCISKNEYLKTKVLELVAKVAANKKVHI